MTYSQKILFQIVHKKGKNVKNSYGFRSHRAGRILPLGDPPGQGIRGDRDLEEVVLEQHVQAGDRAGAQEVLGGAGRHMRPAVRAQGRFGPQAGRDIQPSRSGLGQF